MSIAAGKRERLASLAGVALLHLALGWTLITSLAPLLGREPGESLGVFNVREVPPPPPALRLETQPRDRPDDPTPPRSEDAPARLVAAAAPAAPDRVVDTQVPPPVAAGIVPGSSGNPTALQGEFESRLLGSGSGSAGPNSAGGGFGGAGTNLGKPVTRPELRSGRIAPRDYPRGANGHQGVVETRLSIDAAGAVTGCTVTRSSGNRVLDETTCRLIRERFKYVPARDAQGNAVPGERGWQQRWWLD